MCRLRLIMDTNFRLEMDTKMRPHTPNREPAASLHCDLITIFLCLIYLTHNFIFVDILERWGIRDDQHKFSISWNTQTEGSNRKRAFFLKTLESRGWISTRLKRRFYDFLNHDGFSETDVLSNDFKQVLEVIADKSYVPGSYKIREVYQMLDFC